MFSFMKSLIRCLAVGLWSIEIVVAESMMPNGGLIMRESSKMPVMPEQQPLLSADSLVIRRPMRATSSLRVVVRSFGFFGNRAFTNEVLQSLLTNFFDRELNFADLQSASLVIKNYYRAAGFPLAEVYLPEQSLEYGRVDFVIREEGYEDTAPDQ